MNSFFPSSINLASEPFRRERARNASLGLVCVALACSLLILIILFLHSRKQAEGLRRVIANKNVQLQRFQREEGQFSSVLGKPGNADVFSKSVFLNELIARRAVSWTQVFDDLGTVMPSNMRLIGIRLPQVGAERGAGVNRVELEMTVGSDRPDAIIDLLKRLRESALFGAAEMRAQHPPTQNDPLYKYQVTVAYAQKL